MKAGDLVQMKGPSSKYSWRRGASEGIGVVMNGPHPTEYTMRGCTVFWVTKQETHNVPEDWLEEVV